MSKKHWHTPGVLIGWSMCPPGHSDKPLQTKTVTTITTMNVLAKANNSLTTTGNLI